MKVRYRILGEEQKGQKEVVLQNYSEEIWKSCLKDTMPPPPVVVVEKIEDKPSEGVGEDGEKIEKVIPVLMNTK